MLLALFSCERARPRLSLVLGATTTLEDSGLLAELQTRFKADHPRIQLRVVTGGTGEVLRLAEHGDVDVTITHDPAAESTFVAKGLGLYRRELMYNDFVIAGPPADSASLAGDRDAADAFRRIATKGALFVSRGDDSGTHRKELYLWREAGLTVPQQKPKWYVEAGVGMGEALRVASARGAYVLTDRATFLTMRDKLQLRLLAEGDPRLRNRYGIVRVRSARNGHAADSLAVWLKSERGRSAIGNFGRQEYGRSLFTPVQ